MLKTIKGILIIIMLVTVSIPCYCQNEKVTYELKTTEGRAVDIDTVGSTIVVLISQDAITFNVPDDAKMTRGSEDIGIEDVEIDDILRIDYYTDSDGKLIATNIIDSNLANE